MRRTFSKRSSTYDVTSATSLRFCEETMTNREIKKRVGERIRAEQAEYDERTRRLKERIERGRSKRHESERRDAS